MELLAQHVETTAAAAVASLTAILVMVVTDTDLEQVGIFRATAATCGICGMLTGLGLLAG